MPSIGAIPRGLLATLYFGVSVAAAAPSPAQPATAPAGAVASTTGVHCCLPDFTGLVDQVGPSVVNVRIYKKTTQGQGPQLDDQTREFLHRFFGIPVPPASPPGGDANSEPPDPDSPAAVGSGFIVSSDGEVMTNAHVVDGASAIIVTLADKREFKARLVGADKRTDVAVLKIEAHGLPAVRIGDSRAIRVGEWVLAIGSPFGLENTVTAGIVSAKGRDTGDYNPFIQTDVAVNPGNSGGPLIDMQGQVIGINSQIYSETGGFMGISFAIPIDVATQVARQLEQRGFVVRGKIGVAIDGVGTELADAIGLGKPMGALVRSVEPGGAADAAGVQDGDIITRFDGKAVTHANDLPRIVGDVTPGATVTMEVFRRGKRLTLPIKVKAWEHGKSAGGGSQSPQMPQAAPTGAQRSPIGVAVVDLNAQQRRELDVKAGVMVVAVQPGAARSGLRVGDIVTLVNNAEIRSADQFEHLVSRLPVGKPAALLVQRDHAAQYVLVHPRAHAPKPTGASAAK